ncbi:MAG TPA: hypothetical protein VIY28_11800 [Pseudonocardiaceae bacterium]
MTVTLVRQDGSALRTLERIVVTPGAQSPITGARLLSASQTDTNVGRIPGVESLNLSR